MSETGTNVIDMQGITKTFLNGAVVANQDVDFSVRKGEIHALLGENGAGKTTLMNLLYGMYKATAGDIYVKGEKMEIGNPQEAIRHGIGMVHQHFNLVEVFDVTENIALGLQGQKWYHVEKEKLAADIGKLSAQYGLEIDPRATVEELSVGLKQRVEIIKVLYRNVDILIMDEPTAVLTPNEVSGLFGVLRHFVAQGGTIIYISHKLNEIMEIADRITIMRGGKNVGTYDKADVDKARLADLMVGRKVFFQYDKTKEHRDEDRFVVEGLSRKTEKNATSLKQLGFTVKAGEVLGIAGVDGNGQKELEEVLAGLANCDAGRILLEGEDLCGLTVGQRVERGLGYVPEDRMTTGLIQDFSVRLNLVLRTFQEKTFVKPGLVMDNAKIDENARELVRDYGIKAHSISQNVSALSGGNQQKIVLAREMSNCPKVLIVSQPTRGLDIGAMEGIHKKIIEGSRGGMAVLLISSDLDEILEVADRVCVMYEGRFTGQFVPGAVTEREIGMMMAGVEDRGEAF